MEIFELARLLQDAALDPTEWERALNAVNAFTESFGAVLLSINARMKFAPASSNMSEMMEDYFHRGWHANDKREGCIPLLRQKGIVFDHEFQNVDDIERSDYYADFLARHRRKWFAGVGVQVEGDHWCLALQRSPGSDPFSRADLERLRLVQDSLANTARLSRQIGQTWMSGLQQALSLVGRPAILFDTNARVLDLNDEAVKIVGSFIHGDRCIRFGSAEATSGLNAILRAASGPEQAGARERVISLGKASYRCQAISLLGHRGLIACNAAVLVLMEPAVVSPRDVLRGRYGLTSVEVNVAMAMANGRSVPEAAHENRIKAETVRSYLKSIYRKTEVGKQSQLVALISRLEGERGGDGHEGIALSYP